jgi:copper transport protein
VVAWLVATTAVASALAAAAPPSARAHAVLLETSPVNGAVLERAPERLRLRFDERVGLIPTSLRMYDSDAARVDVGEASQTADGLVEVVVPETLAADTYTIAWRVLSEDSHPIRGAFVFSVGEPVDGGAGVADRILDADADSPAVELGLWLARFIGLGAILACVGGAAVLAFVVPWPDARTRGVWLLVGFAAASLALATVALISLTGVKVAGLGLADVRDLSTARGVIDTEFGKVWLVRAVLALGLAGLSLAAARRPSERWVVPALLLAFSIAGTPALSGHARAEGGLAILSDAVHVAAAGVWAGGLLALSILLVEAGGGRWSLAFDAVPRFSLLALVAVAAVLASGVVSGIVEVGSLGSLWDTTYGRVLLVKVALVVPLLVLGAYNRRVVVPALRAERADPALRRRFTRVVGVEIVLMVAVVAVTAVLVAEPPPKADAAVTVTREGEIGPYLYTLTVEPARAGRNEIHAYVLEQTGQPAEVDEVALSATLADPEAGPLELETRPAGPGHVVALGAGLPLGGLWTFQLDVRKGDFDAWSATTDIPFGKD